MIELYNNWHILVTPAFCARKEMDILDKKKVRKGFTLVELIVVLVILAILAALLIPALTGYIDKARKSQVIAETRMITQAVQAEMSELYASDEYRTQLSAKTNTCTAASKSGDSVLEHEQKVTGLKERYNEIVKLAEVPSITNSTGSFFAITDLNCKIRWVIYSDDKGYCGVYNGGMARIKHLRTKKPLIITKMVAPTLILSSVRILANQTFGLLIISPPCSVSLILMGGTNNIITSHIKSSRVYLWGIFCKENISCSKKNSCHGYFRS